MTRLASTVTTIALVGAMSTADAFTVPQTNAFVVSRTSSSLGPLFMSDDESSSSSSTKPSSSSLNFVERGVSVDQDGKSNVWAIEPKMEVDTKSSEEKTMSALVAVGGLAALAVLAGGILTNLPDPDQF